MPDQRELTTGTFTATLKDGDGNTITSGITDIELSIYDQDGAVVNGVEDVDINNTGRGSLALGVLTITFEPEDHTISGTMEGSRKHMIKIKYTWDSGDKQAFDETYYIVENLTNVP
jgi:hypothetical protein